MGCALCEEQRSRGHKFCSDCGTRLTAAAPGNPVERRQITVLFYDLVGSTNLSNACDPEDFREAIHAFHETAAEAVRPFQAYVGAHVGDGGIVYFGYPVARENAAESAVRAGLALTRAVAKLTLPDGRKAQARVGIATGTGVVGRIEDGDTGNSAVGAVTSLAARLQGLANPGQTVISDTTRKLVGRLFELEDLGSLEAKGIEGGALGFRVIGRSSLDRFEALHGRSTGLIGRETERRQLDDAWRQSLKDGGTGKTVLITAEAGIGKSRFALEFTREKGREGAGRMTVFCTPHGQRTALHPFIAYMRRRVAQIDVRYRAEGTGPIAPDIMRAVLAPNTSDRDFALISRLLGQDIPLTGDLAELTAAQLLDATIDAVIDQLAVRSRVEPLILLFEDLHWADPTSLVLIERILSGRPIERTLVILTARPEHPGAEIGIERATALNLEPFAPDDASALIEQILGGPAAPTLVKAISERAGGVPLFIEELTRAVLDKQALVKGQANGTGSGAIELSENFSLPETLQDSLLARLDALGPAKRIAQVAAVIGRLFSADLLKRLLTATGSGGGALVDDGCAKLQAAGLVQRVGDADSGAYLFRHVVIQEFAYSTLVRQDRRKLNAGLLSELERQADQGSATEPERLAHYAHEAGEIAKAVHYWHQAGLQALAQSTMPEAEARLHCGLDLVAEIPDREDRLRGELDLQLTLGRVLLARYGHASEQIGATFARAKDLAEQVGDRRQMLAALHGLQAHDLQHSRMVSARNRSAEMLALAKEDGDDVWAVIGHRSRGIASFPLGEYRQSAEDLGKGLQRLANTDLTAVRRIVVDDIQAAMQIYRSWSLIFLGEKKEGGELARVALERAEDMGQPYTLAFANIGHLYTRLLLRELDGIEDFFDTTFALCEEFDIWYFMATARIFQGLHQVLAQQPKAAETIALGMTEYRKTGSILYQPTYMHWQALAHLQAGELDQAREVNDWTIATSHQYEMHHQMGEYFGLRAVLLDQMGDPDAARSAAERAQEICDRQDALHCAELNEALWLRYGLNDKIAQKR